MPVNPTGTYHYVYYDHITSGPVTRQNRGNSQSTTLAEIPGVQQPSANTYVTGSKFTANPAAASYPFPNDPNYTFVFAFMSVSGLAEGGVTVYDPNAVASGTVGTSNIVVNAVYILTGGVGGGPGDPYAVIDAFNDTTGMLINNFFVNVTDNPGGAADAGATQSGNVYGDMDTKNTGYFADAYPVINNVVPGPAGVNANLDRWTIPANNPANPLVVGKGSEPVTLAIYSSPVVKPCPKVFGGYNSVDIVLINATTNQILDASTEAILPNTPYIFQATVHNNTNVDAINTQVTFWEIPGGTGANAVWLNMQQNNTQNAPVIPANGSATFQSAVHFMSGNSSAFPLNHNCAAVSVYNEIGGCCTPLSASNQAGFANASAAMPLDTTEATSCVAWRNTDTYAGAPGMPIKFGLGLGAVLAAHAGAAVGIAVNTRYVPLEWFDLPVVKARALAVKTTALKEARPLYLLPDLLATLKPIDLGIGLANEDGTKLELAGDKFIMDLAKVKSTNYTVVGTIPKTAKKGDRIIMTVTAHYPAARGVAALAVDFTMFVTVS